MPNTTVLHKSGELPGLRRLLKAARPYRHGLFVVFIPLCMALTALAASHPQAVETLYSTSVYKALSGVMGGLFGAAPFSVAEMLLLLIVAAIIAWLSTHIVLLFRRDGRGRRLLRMLSDICCVAGIGYLLFTLLCGFNYHRVSFADQSGLTVRDASARELADLYAELIVDANTLRDQVLEDENGVMSIPEDSLREITALAPEGMERLSKRYPVLGGTTPQPKPVWLSRVMSGVNIVGIYIPFTFEANFNRDVPDYNIPFSMLHELSHYKGFMREDEANFLSYLACREMEQPEFAYSGVLTALIHCGNALYDANRDLYWEENAALSEAVLRDFAANAEYWRQFEGPVADAADKVNDVYLKANRQTDGVRSYGRMVDLLLADYHWRHGLD